MNTRRSKIKDEDVIARELWGETTPFEKKRIQKELQTGSDFARELSQHQEIDDLLAMALTGEQGSESISTRPHVNTWLRRASIAAAAVLALSSGLWFNTNSGQRFLNTARNSILNVESTEMVVLYTFGSIYMDKKKLKPGDIIVKPESIEVGANSFCDLQIRDQNLQAVVRLYPNTRYSSKLALVDGVRKYQQHISQGRALFRIDSMLSGDRLDVFLPESKTTITGTQFLVETTRKGYSQVSVIEGSVVNSPLKQESEKHEVNVGQTISIKGTDVNKTALNKNIFQKKLKEAETLKPLNNEGLLSGPIRLSALIEKRNHEERVQNPENLESVFQQNFETLVLKNGKEINGLIRQEGNSFSVQTRHRKYVIPGSEVKSIKF